MEEIYRWRRDDPNPFDLLDIGSGTGTWAGMVAVSGLPVRRIIGLDYAAEMCRVAEWKARQAVEYHAHFVNADSEHIPFTDGSFDLLTCSHSFHHYPNQATTVREMHRVLRPGGRLVVIDGFRDNTIGWVLYDVVIARGEGAGEAKVFHAPWSMMRRFFEEAGFRDIRQRKEGIWTPLLLTVGVA
jgi:ubiquinone/menaquinone biosynthesis C-methylase UbiE